MRPARTWDTAASRNDRVAIYRVILDEAGPPPTGRVPTSGKISVKPTKSLVNQRDLALAYSPGVAYACLAIRDDPKEAATLTSRADLVAVITNGSAVLGLGNIGRSPASR